MPLATTAESGLAGASVALSCPKPSETQPKESRKARGRVEIRFMKLLSNVDELRCDATMSLGLACASLVHSNFRLCSSARSADVARVLHAPSPSIPVSPAGPDLLDGRSQPCGKDSDGFRGGGF